MSVVVLVLASTLVPLETPLGLTAPAGAQTGAVNLLFDKPGTTPRYGANEVVRIEAGNINFVGDCKTDHPTPGLNDWFQPWADLYIVPAGSTFTNNQTLTDAGGSPNNVFGGLAGSFLDAPLGLTFPTGMIAAGVYGVVVDECQNGRWDTLEDSFVDNAFRVEVQADVPPLSSDGAAFMALKSKAASSANALEDIEQLLKLKEIIEKAKSMQEAATAVVSPQSFAVFAINQGVAAAEANTPYAALKDRAQTLARETIAQYRTRLSRLAADPPDILFQRFALPAGAGAWMEESTVPFGAEFQRYIAHYDALSAVAGGILDAVERYQGADELGNPQWAARHARTIQELSALYQAQIPAFEAATVDVKAALANYVADYGHADFYQPIRQVDSAMDDMADGILADEKSLLNAGQDPVVARPILDEWQATIVGEPPDLSWEWDQRFDAASTEMAAFASTLDGLATEASDLEAQLAVTLGAADKDPALGLTITGTPMAGADIQVAVVGAPPGAAAAWDLDGDGEPDDGDGASVTWTVPGDAMVDIPLVISAQVTGAEGQDVVSAVVTVVDGGNQPPALVALNRTYRDIAPGDSTDFEVQATDSDPLTFEWLVNGVTQPGETTSTFTLVTAPTDFGGYFVEVLVSDGAALTRASWFARVLTPDADNDGFLAAPGPDCMDTQTNPGVLPQYVNPARLEVPGNLVDDDCDPTTDDGDVIGSVSLQGIGSGSVGDDIGPTSIPWGHPQRYSGEDFRLTIDWGDGSAPYVQTVAGTTYADTNFALPAHNYGRPQAAINLQACIEYLPPGGDPYEFCSTIRVIDVVNDIPLVNASDLRAWGPVEFGYRNQNQAYSGDWQPLDGQGRSMISIGNPNNFVALPSTFDLPDGGYGRASMTQEVFAGDNDLIGFALGFQPGELTDPNADYVGVRWMNDTQSSFVTNNCNDAPGPNPLVPDPMVVWRQNGEMNQAESYLLATLQIPYDPTDDASADGGVAQDPFCDDTQGPTLLATAGTDGGPPDYDPAGGALWRRRASTLLQFENSGLVQAPYLLEYDYQPDSLRVWIDGVLQVEATPQDPGVPFPPGGVALLTASQFGARVSATAPEPTFAFVQGKGGEFSTEAPDGISMPMIDGWGDTYEIRIDWGDSTATTAGVASQDASTGWGWWDLTGTHVYEQAGQYRGEVCATDSYGLSSCFPFRAEVANVAPVVNAGPDRVTNGDVDLTDMTFQDPGPTDTHTATIDWDTGDATPAVSAPVTAERGGGFITGTYTYPSDGARTIEVCVTDDAGATACDQRILDVKADNVAPTLQVTDPNVGTEGAPASVGLGFVDGNVDDVHTVTVDWGDGTAVESVTVQEWSGAGSATATHPYADNGSYTATVEVCDAVLCDAVATTVEVANAAPVVDAPVLIPTGTDPRTFDLTADFADPGSADTHTATVDWGDGTAAESLPVTEAAGSGSVAATHQFVISGLVDVEVCVTDNDSGVGCTTTAVTVSAIGLPTAPVDVSAVGADREVRLRWKAPGDAGGSPVTDYQVETTPGGSIYTVGGPQLSTVVNGLINDTGYTFRVRAGNVSGWGPWSEPSNTALTRGLCLGAPFTDVDAGHPFCPEIKWMGDNGVSNGFDDGSYRPARAISRQAMAAFSYRLLNPGAGPPAACTTAPFVDVPADHVFCGEIQWMADNGITQGFSDGTFRPGIPVARQAMAAFIYRLQGSPDGPDPLCAVDEAPDVTAGHVFCGEIRWLVANGIAEGYADGDFHPTDPISRQAMAAFIFRYNVLAGLI